MALPDVQASRRCLNCSGELRLMIRGIRDYEYGVPWTSDLVRCTTCGLVTHEPAIRPDQIGGLYPDNYLAHSSASRSRSVYGVLKTVLAQRSVRSAARHVPPGGSCIEIGCGNGSFLRTLNEVRPDIELAGVDIRDVGITGLPRFTFYEGQLEDVDFAGRRFDVIYCSNLIEHVPDPFVFLKKCSQILKPGGVIYGITPDHLSLDRYVFGRFWAGYHYPRHTFVFNHDNIRDILRKCGFGDVRVRGSYGFWYLSLANRFVELPGTKKRGLAFAAVSALFLPFDMAVNLLRCHGSMTFVARMDDVPRKPA